MIKSGKVEKTLHTALTVSVVIAVSKIAGFVREMILASSIGQNIDSDAYSASYKLLSIITIAFSAGIGSVFIPQYTKIRLKLGEERANLYASNILNLFMVVGLILSALGYFFAPQLCAVIWQGSQEGLEKTIYLTRIMCPSIFFWAVSGVLCYLLNGRKNYIPEQLVGFCYTACVILACLAFGTVETVAIGTLVAAVLQVVVVAPFLRGNFRYLPKLNLRDKTLRRTFFLAIPALISIGFDEINTLTDTMFASSITTGAVTALSKSFSLGQTVLGVLITPITTIMFTELSNYAALKQMDRLKETVRRSMEVIALITFPIIVLAIVCGNDIIGAVYQHGRFTAENTAFTTPVFIFYIIGIFGFGLRTFLIRVFYSMQMTRLPLFINMLAVVLNIVLDILWKDPLGAKGLTLATSVASLTSAVIMLLCLHKKLGSMKLRKSAGQFVKIIIASIICFIVAYFVHQWIPSMQTDFVTYIVRLIISGLVGILVYLVMSMLLRVEMLRKVTGMFARRLLKKKSS